MSIRACASVQSLGKRRPSGRAQQRRNSTILAHEPEDKTREEFVKGPPSEETGNSPSQVASPEAKG